MLPPLIVPKPLDVVRTGGVARLPTPLTIDAGPHRVHVEPMLRAAGFGEGTIAWSNGGAVRVSLDRGMAGDGRSYQGYHVDVVADAPKQGQTKGGNRPSIVLRAASAAGLRHGAATLGQILRQYGSTMPAMQIGDEPALANRGVMLDISRDRVPTMDHLREIVHTLALLKCNHLQLYTEHTFAYAGHEEVWRDASPMTGEEYRSLDGWCREVGITLVANQNCFGHLAAWLKKPRYMPMAEIDSLEKVWKFMEWPRPGPFSLCPSDPRSIALVRDMLGQLLPHFSSKQVNINCDETFDVGQGRSEQMVRERGGAAVYFDFVDQVLAIVKEHGFKPMFWADIALSHPEQIGRIAPELLSLAWGYEPDSDFDQWGRVLRGAAGGGREFWVCPGTSAWRSIIGRSSERRGNIDCAMRAAMDHESTGLLMCDWGDLGHRQQWPVSLHGLVDGLQAAWTGKEAGVDPQAESLQVFGDATLSIGAWLEDVGDIDREARRSYHGVDAAGKPKRIKNASALLQDSTIAWGDGHQPSRLEDWTRAMDAAKWLSERVPAGVSQLLRDECAQTTRAAKALTWRALARRGAAEVAGLRSEMSEMIAEHRRLWALRSRPGGLLSSVAHYEKALEDVPS